MNEYKDYIVRATAANQQIRAFAITSRNLVEEGRKRHNTSPVATAALGRLMSAGAMMGVMMKGDKDVLTLQMKGDGPINGVLVTADSKGNVKGYVGNPNVIIPANWAGKLDVGAAIGYGYLTVIKDMGLKEPYSSQVPLGTSEVAEDLTYYFAKSEQVPSAVALGVLMEKDNTVKQAGGFIIQLMPFAEEKVIATLEERISKINSVTSMLEKGMSPEDILEEVLGDLGVEYTDKIDTQFYCDCSREKISKALIGAGKTELQSMIDEGKDIEVNCHFCNTNYVFNVQQLAELKAHASKRS
ncbi:MAG: Hsp33 family molecular chaperone HslO [Lachnospiraceae bacterium]|nr:Hsp33 family molecular chaperone HslO [Lachnospiraceae bacterium]